MNESCHTHVTHMNESWHAYESAAARVWYYCQAIQHAEASHTDKYVTAHVLIRLINIDMSFLVHMCIHRSIRLTLSIRIWIYIAKSYIINTCAVKSRVCVGCCKRVTTQRGNGAQHRYESCHTCESVTSCIRIKEALCWRSDKWDTTQCNTLQHTATHWHAHKPKRINREAVNCKPFANIVESETHCNTLQHTPNTLQHTPTHSNTLTHMDQKGSMEKPWKASPLPTLSKVLWAPLVLASILLSCARATRCVCVRVRECVCVCACAFCFVCM